MKRGTKSIKALLQACLDNGSLKPAQFEVSQKRLHALDKALQSKKLSKIEDAVNEFARTFLQ